MAAAEYVVRAWLRWSRPTLASWVLMTLAFTEAVFVYWVMGKYGSNGNIGNIGGWLNVCFITLGVLLQHWWDGTLRVAFNEYQRKCLRAARGIFCLWIVALASQNAFWQGVSYILTQLLALVGYFPLVDRLNEAYEAGMPSPEPVTIWYTMFAAGICAIYPAIISGEWMAGVYLIRAIPSAWYVIKKIHSIDTRHATLAGA